MRASAVVASLSGIAAALFAASYLATSKVSHKAELIRVNPNGDIVWLERWEADRATSLACAVIFLLIFICALVVMYRARRDEI